MTMCIWEQNTWAKTRRGTNKQLRIHMYRALAEIVKNILGSWGPQVCTQSGTWLAGRHSRKGGNRSTGSSYASIVPDYSMHKMNEETTDADGGRVKRGSGRERERTDGGREREEVVVLLLK